MSKYKSYKEQKAEVAKRIIKLRKERGYKTQMEWAIALYKPVWGSESKAKDKVRERDTYRVNYTVDELIRVCNLLNVDMDYLLGKQDEETHEIKDLKELTGLSEKACSIIADYTKRKTEEEWIEEHLQGESPKNSDILAKIMSWLIENRALQILSDLGTVSDAYWYLFNNEKPPEYDFYNPNNVDNQFVVQIERNQRELIKIIEEYSLAKR